LSEYSNYQASELSEIDDEFFGVDFNAGVNRTDSNITNTLYSTINQNLPVLPPQREEQVADNLTASTYPLSPKLTSIPSTPSPKSDVQDLSTKLTISQHELTTGLHNSRFQPFTPHTPLHPTSVQFTPENSGSSHTSAEGVGPSTMADHQWTDQQAQASTTSRQPGGQYGGATNSQNFDSRHVSNPSGFRGDDGAWRLDQRTGQAGLNPEQRRMLGDVEMPTLKQQEEQRRIESKNIEVQEWRSQAGDSSDDEDINQSYFGHFSSENFQRQPEAGRRRSLPEDNGIQPMDETQSIHENHLIEGQTYYHPKNGTITDEDIRLMTQSRHWSDAPMLPKITMTNLQPETANDAIRRWNDNSDALSLKSRTATWGTRRRSETNLTDMEGVSSGSFLSKLSISKTKDRDGNRPRQNSLFDQGLHSLANIVRNRSDSKLKRNRSSQDFTEEMAPGYNNRPSQDSLAPPSSSNYNRRSVPNVNTVFAAMTGPLAAVGATHARSGSISAKASSPKSPTVAPKNLGFTRTIIQRARSRSELSVQEKASQQPGLTQLWKTHGGPPVANLASPPLDKEIKQQAHEVPDHDDDDDDDDEQLDEGDLKHESEHNAEPIIPNYEGFKDHVRRLNPDMHPQYKWLVSRIAHQQEIRYKNLLDLRVKHSQATANRNCVAGRHCVELGGSATLLDAQGKPRESEHMALGLQVVTDFSDHDSNPGEGALTEETFPLGVPMPASRNLPAEFECQLCFKAKKFQKPSDWTKHVHEDVQPFTCTYDKCKEPKSFKRKADWVRHENERHRHLEWWICQVDDCRHPCYRKDNFLQHLVREHKLPEPKQKTKAAIKKARGTEPAWIMLEKCHHETEKRPQDEPCKFCGKTFNTWKKLTVHLAKHMEHISLPVLRLVEAKHVDANTIISPVEQILTPNTPISRQKMEPTSPFPMGSVSPHIPLGPQFTSGFEQPPYYQTSGTSVPFGGMQVPLPQDINYEQSQMYESSYIHQMNQSRAYGSMHTGASNIDNMQQQVRGFGQLSANYPPPKMEQTRGFGPMESEFSQVLPDQPYGPEQSRAFPVQHNYVSNGPPVSGYQAPNMLVSMNDQAFGFDHLAVNGSQNYQQQHIPMTRGPGSASSYGHSPQTNVPYYGHP